MPFLPPNQQRQSTEGIKRGNCFFLDSSTRTGTLQEQKLWPTSQGIYLMGLSYINQYCSPNAHPFNGSFSTTTQVSQYQKGKTNLDFTEARDSEWGSGISWAICKSAPCSRQITTPAPHRFYRPKCTFIRQGHETDRQTDVRQQCLLPSPILYKWGTIQLPQTNGQCSALTYCSICNRRTSMKGTMKSFLSAVPVMILLICH